MTTLDYTRYPLGPNEIRLISLAPPPADRASRKWILEVCGLRDAKAPYYALSYRWGAPLSRATLGKCQINQNGLSSSTLVSCMSHRI